MEEYCELISDFVQLNLKDYYVVKSNTYGPYFYVEFKNNVITVVVSGDFGGFNITIDLFGTIYDLWRYDRRVSNATITNYENILYQLEILKSFLLEVGK